MNRLNQRVLERLAEMEIRFEETLAEMAEPDVSADATRLRDLGILHSELKPVVEAYREYKGAIDEMAEATEMLESEDDSEMREYLTSMHSQGVRDLEGIVARLQLLLVPRDPDDDKDVIVELRPAAGGDEAGLWATDLHRMYERFAERHGWSTEPINLSWADGGGLTFGQFAVKGKGAYSRFKWEAGPHRVQRVPKTESQGRIHTSIATVAVLPEVEDVEVEIHDNDLEIETMRSTGPGGQSVNTTDSAVRITHIPTGLVVSCQDEKSQLQNKLKAMRVLRARLYQQQLEEQMGERSDTRRSQVGTGERAEKIRTYNFKENRVTDHRVGRTVHSLPAILDGDLDGFHESLMAQAAADVLAGDS
jgi:peptide chain release factor 1